MIAEEDFRKNKEIISFEEPEGKHLEITMEEVYKIIEHENIYDFLPAYDLQDEELTQDILEVYKILFWGISAVVSTLLWLYFFLS